MSDPYAEGLGLSDTPTTAPTTTARNRSTFSSADWQAVSAAQRFDSNSAAIVAQEVAEAKTPADRAAALRTQAYTQAKIAQQATAAPAANDQYAEGLGLGASPARASPASKSAITSADGLPPIPAKGVPVSKPGADPYSDAQYAKTGSGYYDRPGESWWESYSRNSEYDQLMRDAKLRQPADPLKMAASVGSSIAGSVAGGLHGLWTRATGGDAKAAADNVEKTSQGLTYTPSDPESAAQVGMVNSGANPLNWPAIAGDWVGERLGEAGYPGVGATVATAGAAVPMLFGMKPVRSAATTAVRSAGSTLADLMKSGATPAPRIEPTLESGPPSSAPEPVNSATPAPSQTATPAPTGRPVALPATPALKPTFSDPANNIYADSAPDVKGGVTAADQARRQAVLNEIGLNQVRRSAITGDANQAAIDFQTSRLKGSPGGDSMSQQLSTEKATIGQYADDTIAKTGGSSMNDQNAKIARGNTILTPLEGLKEWFDKQTSALYKTADERAQGVPTQLDNFRSVLGDDSLATNSDRVNLRTAAGAYAKKLGIIGDDGKVFANAQQAETMRKYLNENWSPQNSGLVGKLKDALDSDVMSAAGEDVYGQARALRAQRATTLDNPDGIAKLLDSSGPQGVNRAVAVEKVADTLTNMPVAQLKNIVSTLKDMPPELQPMAQDALAEIKAQYAHNVKDIGANQAGQWNAKGVQKYLSNNSARMGAVFEPEEMKRFGTLNDAGNILAKDQSYPGAYAQQQNLLRAGVSHAISGGATAAGATVGGPLGAAVGNVIGGKMAGKFNDASTLRATQKRMVSLKDLMSGAP